MFQVLSLTTLLLICVVLRCHVRSDDFSHQVVGLRDPSGKAGRAHCSGVLATKSHVITAAHCLYKVNKTEVHYGSKIWGSTSMAAIKKVNIHPGYIPKRLAKSDIAVIELGSALGVDNISFKMEPWRNPRPGQPKCFLYGWTNDSLTKYPVDARHVVEMCTCLPRYEVARTVCMYLSHGMKLKNCSVLSGGPIFCGENIVGIFHASYNPFTCKSVFYGSGDKACAASTECHLGMYLCPYIPWLSKIVPEGIPQLESCSATWILPGAITTAMTLVSMLVCSM
ncbi:hypothetical protein AAG570_005648 [Ranatra chinensis]|uniref:Peptidase S1 domain-containing protein n=1 Tax=Ranatra chinensis TaxID=642074 RepID=A0ABD0XYE7_9HEMI